jgi:hypothetical protein
MKRGLAILGVLFAVLIGYFAIYQPFQAAQAERARVELVEGLPVQMDALYQTVFEETKVQQAVMQAEELRTRGKNLAAEGDRAGAQKALAELTALRDQLRQEYVLQIVNRPGERSGFWTFPEINTAATNYYLVVEAVDGQGKKLSLPIRNEEDGTIETVSQWGVRVPETVYNAIVADKQDDGIIQNNELGLKADGFLDVEYNMPVLGGAVTRW